MGFILQEGNQLFAGALVLMLLIAFVESLMVVLGAGFSSFLDNLLPDIDVDLGLADAELSGGLTKILAWFRFGEVPAIVILVVFLTSFGISGLLIQMFLGALFGTLLPAWILAIPVLLLASLLVRYFGNFMRKFSVGDETESVSRSSFIGRLAVVTVGEAVVGSPAEARFRDEFGTTHYVMVEPYDDGEAFSQGQTVVLVEELGVNFKVIAAATDRQMNNN